MNTINPELAHLTTTIHRMTGLHHDLDQAANGIKAGQLFLSRILEAEQGGDVEFPLSAELAKGCILDGISVHLTFIHARLDELRATIDQLDQHIRLTPEAWQAARDATSTPGVTT
jgi:hypothetical protein